MIKQKGKKRFNSLIDNLEAKYAKKTKKVEKAGYDGPSEQDFENMKKRKNKK
jgi:hypothetical protein